jgi:hypothetical protein
VKTRGGACVYVCVCVSACMKRNEEENSVVE